MPPGAAVTAYGEEASAIATTTRTESIQRNENNNMLPTIIYSIVVCQYILGDAIMYLATDFVTPL